MNGNIFTGWAIVFNRQKMIKCLVWRSYNTTMTFVRPAMKRLKRNCWARTERWLCSYLIACWQRLIMRCYWTNRMTGKMNDIQHRVGNWWKYNPNIDMQILLYSGSECRNWLFCPREKGKWELYFRLDFWLLFQETDKCSSDSTDTVIIQPSEPTYSTSHEDGDVPQLKRTDSVSVSLLINQVLFWMWWQKLKGGNWLFSIVLIIFFVLHFLVLLFQFTAK